MSTEEAAGAERSLEYTPTWVVAVVFSFIVLISLLAERGLHQLGKWFKRKHQDKLYEALQKLKEELMLLGFISLLLTVFQDLTTYFCVPPHLESIMLPCKIKSASSHLSWEINRRNLVSENIRPQQHCASKGKVPLLSLEALHQLHIFVFILAVVHLVFCVTTMFLGGAKIKRWKQWETSIRSETSKPLSDRRAIHVHHLRIFRERAGRYWRKFTVISMMVAFFKQFYGSVTKSDYIALRTGFIRAHCPSIPNFDFQKYILRTLEHDFKKIVTISAYLWLFSIIFLLINIAGWNAYFWMSFLPLILLLLVGAKLEHIITELAKAVEETTGDSEAVPVKPSDELFWFHNPVIVLYLIQFILFQNSYEIAFFLWIWFSYGFKSCIMEHLGFIITRLIIGVIVQVLCSYSTLPLYALVTQMGSRFKEGMFDEYAQGLILDWARRRKRRFPNTNQTRESKLIRMSKHDSYQVSQKPAIHEGILASVIQLTNQSTPQTSSLS